MKKSVVLLLLLILIALLFVPAYSADASGAPALELLDVYSETAVLMDADTGQVLYGKDMDKSMYPASITKIMTGMLALKYGKLTDTVTMSKEAVAAVDRDSANIALSTGEQLPLEEALYALSVASANDAANGIAETIGGTLDGFVTMMNDAAAAAGAVNTHFTNANGLPDENHYTTAHDMARITAQALKIPGFTEIFSEKRYKIPPTNKQPETRILNSSNRFLNGGIFYDGLLMSKAGWTREAEHTLVTAASRNGTTLIAVVMKSADSAVKWSDTTALLDYGFTQFDRITVTGETLLKAAPAVIEPQGPDAPVLDPDSLAARDVSLLLPRGLSPDDIQITFGEPRADIGSGRVEIPVRLSLPPGGALNGPSVLAETVATAALQTPTLSDVADNGKTATAAQKSGIFRMALIFCLSVVGLLLLAFAVLLVRRAVIVRRRRRKKLESGQRSGRR